MKKSMHYLFVTIILFLSLSSSYAGNTTKKTLQNTPKITLGIITGCNNPAIHAHFGFIPEIPKDSLYKVFVEVMKGVGQYALDRGINIYIAGYYSPFSMGSSPKDGC